MLILVKSVKLVFFQKEKRVSSSGWDPLFLQINIMSGLFLVEIFRFRKMTAYCKESVSFNRLLLKINA